MASRDEPCAERCIDWHDDGDTVSDQSVEEEDSLTFLSPPRHQTGETRTENRAPDIHTTHERRIAYDTRDHTRWQQAGPVGHTSAGGHPVTGDSDGAHGKYVMVLPRALAQGGHGGDADAAVHLLRLPHPRGGQPSFCLLHAPSAAAPQLYELQAQGPANDFGQTFVVGDTVLGADRHGACATTRAVLPLALSHSVTSHDVLVATPMNPIFLALHALVARRAHAEGGATAFTGEDATEDWDAWAAAQPFVRATDLVWSAEDGRSLRTREAAPAPASSPFAQCGASDAPGEEDEAMTTTTAWPPESTHDDDNHHHHNDGDDDDDAAEEFGSGEDFVRAFRRQRLAAQTASTAPTPHHTTRPAAPQTSGSAAASPVPLQYGWWPGWAVACGRTPDLARYITETLTADCVLASLCEVTHLHTMPVYRFAPAKAATWLKAKVASVRASTALASILQLPPVHPVDQGSRTTTSPSPPPLAPLDVAIAVVGEYVPEGFQRYMAAACGLSAAPVASALAASASSGLSGSGVKRSRAELEEDLRQQQQQQKAMPKSASVKRLEKAGRPANTPTLMAMFAKKTPASTDKK